MKWHTKSYEPAEMVEWKAQANEDWTPGYSALQNPQKRVLHVSLLEEQGWVCCYCGGRIQLENSHIEHFRPQESWPALQLNYTNLHASCVRETQPGQPLHCGHAKGSELDEALAISPLQQGCEERFIYTLDGQIVARGSDAGASYMIRLLRLDQGLLSSYRRQALLGVFDLDFLTTATDEELRELARHFRRRESGRCTSFGHVVARFAEQFLGV